MEIFGTRVLVPDPTRDPVYDSTSARPEEYFRFGCVTCNSTLAINLPSYIGNYQDSESVLGPEQSEAIRVHFGLRADRSLIDGWPKFRVESCGRCRCNYLVYVAVHEPANGWFRIVPQGVTQLPSNNSSKPTPLRGAA